MQINRDWQIKIFEFVLCKNEIIINIYNFMKMTNKSISVWMQEKFYSKLRF